MAKCLARGVKLNRRWGGRDLVLCPSLDSSLSQTKREQLANEPTSTHFSLGLAFGWAACIGRFETGKPGSVPDQTS